MSKLIDMTGWTMSEHGVPESRLKVIERSDDYIDPQGNHRIRWLCECMCSEHKRIIVQGTHLRDGNVLSCGCLQKEKQRERKKKNKYNLSGEYGVLWTTNTNKEVYFDLSNSDKILAHTWYETANGYPTTTINGKHVTMHCFLGYPWHDHKNMNKKDNRIENFRQCTKSENNINKAKTANRSSKYIGVSYITRTQKWTAQICVNYKNMYLGSFSTEQEALIARLRAEEKYFKEFAPQKYLFEQYNINQQDVNSKY